MTRASMIALKVSATATIRAPRGIALPPRLSHKRALDVLVAVFGAGLIAFGVLGRRLT